MQHRINTVELSLGHVTNDIGRKIINDIIRITFKKADFRIHVICIHRIRAGNLQVASVGHRVEQVKQGGIHINFEMIGFSWGNVKFSFGGVDGDLHQLHLFGLVTEREGAVICDGIFCNDMRTIGEEVLKTDQTNTLSCSKRSRTLNNNGRRPLGLCFPLLSACGLSITQQDTTLHYGDYQ